MLATLRSAAVFGLEAYPVHVEVDVAFGLPQFSMVGLPDATVRYERVSLQHRFNVERDGLSFELQLPDLVLERKGLRELEEVAHTVARQVRSYRA